MAGAVMDYLIGLCFFVAAVLYTSVGHAGASGYIVVMMLAGVPIGIFRPVALVLNICVASFTTWRFAALSQVKWRLVVPLAIMAIPAAYLAGKQTLPVPWFKGLLAACLMAAAWRMWRAAVPQTDQRPMAEATIPALLTVGAVVGTLSGLSGTGGGIFLTPVLLTMRWAPVRIAAGVSAAFILLTSIAGLAGGAANLQNVPHAIWLWIPCALLGAVIGTHLGTQRLGTPALRRMLAICLVVAAGKFGLDAVIH